MTALPLRAIQIRRAGQQHPDHEGKSLELRAYAQARYDQIGLGDVSSGNRLERLGCRQLRLLEVGNKEIEQASRGRALRVRASIQGDPGLGDLR